jgi:hypothetical protein
MVITDGGKSGKAASCLAERAQTGGVASGARILLGGDRPRLLMTRFGKDGARVAEPAGSDGVFDTWTERKPEGLPLAAFTDGFQARDNPREYLLVAAGEGSSGGIYRTVDSGKTFRKASGVPPTAKLGYYWSINGYNSMYDDPADPDRRYYLANGAGFLRSEDRGQSWKKVGTGLAGSEGQLARDRNGTLWAAMGNASREMPEHRGLYRSADGGETWTCVGDFEFLYPRVDAIDGRIAVFVNVPAMTGTASGFRPTGGTPGAASIAPETIPDGKRTRL